jgi:hypothetical protein
MAAQSAQGIRAGRAYVELGTDNKGVDTGLDDAAKKVKEFGEGVAKVGAAIAAAGALVTLPFDKAGEQFAEMGERMVNMAARTGVSVEALSALGYAADQTGTDLIAVEDGIKHMQREMVAAAQGNQEALVSFNQLGLSVQALGRLKPDQQLGAVANAIARIPNPTLQAATAIKLLGRNSTQLIPLIENFGALTKEAEEFGLITSTESAEAGQKLGQSMKLLTAVVRDLSEAVGEALAPMFEEFSMSASRVINRVRAWVAANKPLINQVYNVAFAVAAGGAAIAAFGAAVAAAGVILGGIIATVGALVTAFSAVGAVFTTALPIASALAAITSPLGFFIAMLTAAVALGGVFLYKFTNVFQTVGAVASSVFGELQSTVMQAFKGMSDAFKAGDLMLAAQILWAGLKVIWLQGTNYIQGIWSDWGLTLRQAFADVSTAIASLALNFWARLRIGMLTLSANVIQGWSDLWETVKGVSTIAINAILAVWDRLVAGVQAKLLEFKAAVGLISETEAAAKAKLLREGAEAGIGARTSAFAETGREEETRRERLASVTGGLIAGIENERVEQQKALAGGAEAEAEARRQAAAAAAKQAGDNLAAAKGEFAALQKPAADAAAGVSEKVATKAKGAAELGPQALAQGLGAAESKIDVKGSFGAFAARGLGIGDTLSDTVKEQKKTNEQLQQLNQKASQGALVFGS